MIYLLVSTLGGKRVNKHGYTVVEVMIFLAVSGALVISALSVVGGRQAKTDFSQSARDLESRLGDIINDVSTGYYPNIGGFSCTAPSPGGGVNITQSGPATKQGENADCIFVGRVLQFRPSDTPNPERTMRVYTVAGQRRDANRREVTKLVDTKAAAIAASSAQPNAPNAFEDFDLGTISIDEVYYGTAPGTDVGGFGIFTTFGTYGTDLALDTGNTSANIAALPGTQLDRPSSTFAGQINSAMAASLAFNHPNGITICFTGGANQHGIISIGGNSRALTTNLIFGDGDCPTTP